MLTNMIDRNKIMIDWLSDSKKLILKINIIKLINIK